jgi:hypothetical protein
MHNILFILCWIPDAYSILKILVCFYIKDLEIFNSLSTVLLIKFRFYPGIGGRRDKGEMVEGVNSSMTYLIELL